MPAARRGIDKVFRFGRRQRSMGAFGQRKSAGSALEGGALLSLVSLLALIGVEQRVKFFADFHGGRRVQSGFGDDIDKLHSFLFNQCQ